MGNVLRKATRQENLDCHFIVWSNFSCDVAHQIFRCAAPSGMPSGMPSGTVLVR